MREAGSLELSDRRRSNVSPGRRFSPFGRFHVHQASRAAKQEEQRLQHQLQQQQLQLQEQLQRQQQQMQRHRREAAADDGGDDKPHLSATEDQVRLAHLRRRQQQLQQQQAQLTQLAPPSREESLNLTSAIWFSWGVLLNSGIGEGDRGRSRDSGRI